MRDSAGVRIVENPSRTRAAVVFQLGTTPIMDVGGLEDDNPDNEFAPNQGYLRGAHLSDRGFAVTDVVRVHYFGADGKRQRISGRKGAGPEEFLYLTSVCRTRGDTIVVNDSHNKRLGILDNKGKIVRTVRQDQLGSLPFDACLDDGTLIMESLVPSAPGTPSTRRVTRIRLDGTVVNPVGDFTFAPFDMVTQSSGTILAAQKHIYVGDAAISEVRVYTAEGKLARVIRSADPQIRISNAEAEERMRGTIPRGTANAEERMQRMRSQPRREFWPAYRSVLVDPRGHVWIQDYALDRLAPDGWTAFDAEGRMVGRLVIPTPPQGQRRMNVITFGVNEVLVRRTDEDGAAHLTLLPIQQVRR